LQRFSFSYVKRTLYRHSGKLALLWAAAIFALCATPGEYLPKAWWLELISADKLVHVSLFYILSSLLLITLAKKRSPVAWIAVALLACALYGASLEYMQAAYFRNRGFDYADMIANAVGVVAGWWLFPRLLRYLTSEHTGASAASDRAS
jgi:VanZ family protein